MNCRISRSDHIEWAPSSIAGSVILLGGVGKDADLTAEIVPGIKAKFNFTKNEKVV